MSAHARRPLLVRGLVRRPSPVARLYSAAPLQLRHAFTVPRVYSCGALGRSGADSCAVLPNRGSTLQGTARRAARSAQQPRPRRAVAGLWFWGRRVHSRGTRHAMRHLFAYLYSGAAPRRASANPARTALVVTESGRPRGVTASRGSPRCQSTLANGMVAIGLMPVRARVLGLYSFSIKHFYGFSVTVGG